MKSVYRPFMLLIVLILAVGTACGGPQPEVTKSSCKGTEDLRIQSDTNARLYLDGSDGLISKFEKAAGKSLCVDYASGSEAQRIKTQILSKTPETFLSTDYHAMIFDSAIYAEGLSDQVFLGKSYPGIWIRKDSVDKFGLVAGQILTQDQYALLMENGLKMITASALIDTAASLTFFNTMSGYYGPYNQLTIDQVQNEGARNFGKRIYDYYTKSNSDPVKLAFDDAMSSQNLYDGVVAFESAFLGADGLNSQLLSNGKNPFVFFYFNPSVEAMATIGRAPSITEEASATYSLFTKFLTSEEAQLYILSVGVHPQKNVADPDTNVFKSDWGLLVDPQIVFAAPPTPSVARAALEIYRDYYKRAKEVNIIIDNSGSIGEQDIVLTIPAGFKEEDLGKYCGQYPDNYKNIVASNSYDPNLDYTYSITRTQAIACAIETFSDESWMQTNGVKPGTNDVINYWLFSDTVTSKPIATSVGPNTSDAGDYVANLIGPAYGPQDLGQIAYTITTTFDDPDGNDFVPFSNTYIFNSTYYVNEEINKRFDQNVDYYIVPLTDGENTAGWNGSNYYSYWLNNAKLNITLTGIQFGGNIDSSDVSSDYTKKFGGDSFVGTSNDQLIKAFVKIFGN